MPISPTDLRIFIYRRLIDDGIMPSSAEVAGHFSVAAADARDAIRTMRIGKTVLPDPTTGEIWMAGPFSAQPTTYRVTAGKRSWWANCAWDMIGIAALVQEPVDIEASCTDCGTPMPMRVDLAQGVRDDSIVHFLVPARRWYDDIGFT